MAKVTAAGRPIAGNKVTITGAAPQTNSDLLTIHGVTLTYQEWIRRGVIRVTSTSGNNRDIHFLCDPAITA